MFSSFLVPLSCPVPLKSASRKHGLLQGAVLGTFDGRNCEVIPVSIIGGWALQFNGLN